MPINPWSQAAERIAGAACRALPSRLSRSERLVELQMEIGGRFPRIAATWVVDPQAPAMAMEVTRSTILRTLPHQPLPFEGTVQVRANGRLLCAVHVRVDRHG